MTPTATAAAPSEFDDFLGLAEQNLSRARLIVLHGISGSGKSTALRFLAERHPSLCRLPTRTVRPSEGETAPPDVSGHLVLVDEILASSHLAIVRSILQRGNVAAVASHLSPWRPGFWPLRLRWRTRAFATDRDPAKISRHLARRGVPHTQEAVAWFCRLYGANYLDVEHILERHPGRDFDTALTHFQKFCTLTRTPRPRRQ